MVAASLSVFVVTGAWGVVCFQKEARFALAMWTLTKNTDTYISIYIYIYTYMVVDERRFTDVFKSNEKSESSKKKVCMFVRSVF